MSSRWALIIALPLLAAGCASVDSVSRLAGGGSRIAGNQLLVTMRQESGPAISVLGDPGAFYLRRRGYGPTPGVDRMLDRIADEYSLRRVEGWYISSIGEYCEVYELMPGQSMDDVLERLSADPRIGLAQAMNVFETQGVIYDDPYASMQPALTSLSIGSAHELATGRGVLVAIVDSSVDSRHGELRGKILSEEDLVEGRARRHAEVHGTAVAGVIGSTANNGQGIVGVAPDVAIASLRACRTEDLATGRAQCSSFSLAQAMESAIRLDADIINLSLSGPPDPLLAELIDAAIGRDIIVITAMPETLGTANTFPSSHAGVIAAESSDAPLTTRIAGNRLRAPGTEVMSTVPNNRYAFFSGNSMSAAHVTGVAALIREHLPDITPAELLRLLRETGHDGIVNACAAFTGIAVEGAAPCMPAAP